MIKHDEFGLDFLVTADELNEDEIMQIESAIFSYTGINSDAIQIKEKLAKFGISRDFIRDNLEQSNDEMMSSDDELNITE